MSAELVTATSIADQKAAEARTKRGRHRTKHYFWTKDADVARELNIQIRSICGRYWGWPLRGIWDLNPGWHVIEGEPCKVCLRMAGRTEPPTF